MRKLTPEIGFGNAYIFISLSSSVSPVRGNGRKKKYPSIKNNFESLNQDDVYFAGTVTHSLDFRKSAGGFIHGFRYNIRVLHRLLEHKYHGVKWPVKTLPTAHLLQTIVKRINEASALYQMFGILADVIIIRYINAVGWSILHLNTKPICTICRENDIFDHLEEFPVRLLPLFVETTGYNISETIDGGKARGYLIIDMEYGKAFSGPSADTFREGNENIHVQIQCTYGIAIL